MSRDTEQEAMDRTTRMLRFARMSAVQTAEALADLCDAIGPLYGDESPELTHIVGIQDDASSIVTDIDAFAAAALLDVAEPPT